MGATQKMGGTHEDRSGGLRAGTRIGAARPVARGSELGARGLDGWLADRAAWHGGTRIGIRGSACGSDGWPGLDGMNGHADLGRLREWMGGAN